MLLKLLNTSEHITESIIHKTLKNSNYRVYAQLPINRVIDRNSLIFEKVDKEFFRQASFDFVIYNSNSLPVLVIEFDGPCHEQFEKKKQSDIKKNRLCRFVELPLIRIGDVYIEEHDKISLLEYILSRFILWDNEGKELTNQMYEILSTSSEDEFEVLTNDGFIDPSIDPTVIFDLKYPFLATIEIAKRLWNEYRIVSIFLPRHLGHSQNENCLEIIYGGERVTYIGQDILVFSIKLYLTGNGMIKGEKQIKPIHQYFESSFSIRHSLPVVNDYKNNECILEYYKRTGKLPSMFADIPGTSSMDLAENFSNYLTIKAAERWVIQNLSKYDILYT